ncbi:MAG: M23 family metallopeptidase [Paracoccaceae bacterium]
MTALILLVQVALPLALLGWLALMPAGSALAWLIQAAGVVTILFALARIAQWAVPVWWLPWVYGALWLLIMAAGIAELPARPLLPAGVGSWAVLGLSAALLALGGWYGARAVAGRALPSVEVVDIANPFGPGHFLVGHGGSNPLVNGHMRTLDATIERFRPWRGQSYAVDFFGLGPFGLRARGWRPADPAAYAIFGARLHAPCDGTVVAAEGDMPDFDVPQEDPVNRLGNHVILRCGGVDIVLAHMRQGSIAVATGQTVTTGTLLGEVGNSGASTEPHLHIHAQRPGTPEEPISGEPFGIRIDGRFLVRGDRLRGRGW